MDLESKNKNIIKSVEPIKSGRERELKTKVEIIYSKIKENKKRTKREEDKLTSWKAISKHTSKSNEK